MRITSVEAQAAFGVQRNNLRKVSNTQKVSNHPAMTGAQPSAIISFSGLKNKNQVAMAVAELPPFMKVGGVATVANDYMNMGDWLSQTLQQSGVETQDKNIRVGMFMPYYNGEIQYDRTTGYPTGVVKPRMIDGKPVFINPDVIKKTPMEDIAKKKLYTELEEVTSIDMQWGLEDKSPVKLFKVKNPPIPQKNVDVYMIFNDATAGMAKAYEGGIAYSSGSKIVTDGFKGQPYAKFSKAFVETMGALEKDGFAPETIICSDAQTSYVAEYAARHNLAGDDYFKGLKVSHIFHNTGAGYCGETSAKNMFANFATKEQIEKVLDDKNYFKALYEGKEEEYFRQFIRPTLDANNTANPNMIPLHHLKSGYVTAVDTVSEGYAEAIAKNPGVSPGLYPTWSELYKENKVGGILNGFEDPKVSPFKPLNLEGFSTTQKVVDSKGVEQVFEPFEVYKPKESITFEDMLATKKKNKINLLRRFSGDIQDNAVISGSPNRSVKLLGGIDPKYVKMLEEGKDVPLFDAWGRADFQKGHVMTLNAFKKFAKTKEGENALLIMGAGLVDGQDESKRIKSVLDEILADKNLKGRVAFVDGFAPAYALASASDATLVPSTFAPCELVDIEAARYFSTPIVTNTQGLAQKNFDPRNATEAARANAYKTVHEFNMQDSLVDNIIKAFTGQDKEAQAAVKQEFSLVDPETFETFGKNYNKMLEKHKLDLKDKVDPEYLEKCASSSMKKSDEYKKLIIGLKERILEDELVDAMQERVRNSDNETARNIFKNQLETDPSWTRNTMLHPSGQTSWEMYKQRHIDPVPADATDSVFSFNEKGIKSITSASGDTVTTGFTGNAAKQAENAAQGVAENITQGAKQTAQNVTQNVSQGAKQVAKKSGEFLTKAKKLVKDKRAWAALAGVALVGSIIAATAKKDKKSAKTAETPKMPEPDTLQAQPTQSIQPANTAVTAQTPPQPHINANSAPSMNKFVAHFSA